MKALFVLVLIFASGAIASDAFPFPQKAESGAWGDINQNLVKEYEKETASSNDKAVSLRLQKENQKILGTLEKTQAKQSIDQIQAKEMTKFLTSHPIVGDKGIKKYTGKNRQLGFCYGRATLAHVELLRRGVMPESIRKIFVLGELMYGQEVWELHIATLVKNPSGSWWVLDGLFEGVLEVKDWYQKILKIGINKKFPKIRLYVTDPVKFLPVTGPYDQKDMYKPEYNGFFQDLTAWLAANPVKKEEMFF